MMLGRGLLPAVLFCVLATVAVANDKRPKLFSVSLVKFRNNLTDHVKKDIVKEVKLLRKNVLAEKNQIMDNVDAQMRVCFRNMVNVLLELQRTVGINIETLMKVMNGGNPKKQLKNTNAVEKAKEAYNKAKRCFGNIKVRATMEANELSKTAQENIAKIRKKLQDKYMQEFKNGMKTMMRNLEGDARRAFAELTSVPKVVGDALVVQLKGGAEDGLDELHKVKRQFMKPLSIGEFSHCSTRVNHTFLGLLASAVVFYIFASVVSLCLCKRCVRPEGGPQCREDTDNEKAASKKGKMKKV
uniref:Conserved plasma membrane protein n=1 Tax=Steinernema glaseri TaxID=37863 RepID=A0A1I7XYS3_9BILA